MTHLSQPDEHLRRAVLEDRVRAGLTYAISRLTDEGVTDPAEHRSGHQMTEAARLGIVQRHATDTLGWTDAADELIRALLAVMPEISDEDVTRDEYATALRLKMAGVSL